jgi:hypothetical protein
VGVSAFQWSKVVRHRDAETLFKRRCDVPPMRAKLAPFERQQMKAGVGNTSQDTGGPKSEGAG